MTVRQTETEDELRSPTAALVAYLRGSISILYLIRMAWAGRLLIAAITTAGLLYGVYTVYRNGPHYTAAMRISPAESDTSLGGGGASGLLAGLTGGSGTVALPKFTQFMLSKSSTGVARDLDRKYDLLCRIFAGDCNLLTHQWKERTGIRETFNGMLARLASLPNPNGPRTIDDLAEYVGGAVIFTENKNNSLVLASYTNSKPEFAAMFLTAVVKSTNDYVRARSRETQKRYVEYLSVSAAHTANVEQRTAIDALLLQEERQLMMTEVDVPYAAQVLDGPIVKPVNDALKIIVLDTFIGLLLGTLLAVSRDLVPRQWRFW
jgi:hypothetical protein